MWEQYLCAKSTGSPSPLHGLWAGASTEWPHSFLVHLNPQLPSLHSSSPPCLPIPDTHSTTYTVPQTLLAQAHVRPSHQNALLPCVSAHWAPVPLRLNAISSEKPSSVSCSIYFPLLGAAGFPSCAAPSFQHLFECSNWPDTSVFSELPKGKNLILLIFLNWPTQMGTW